MSDPVPGDTATPEGGPNPFPEICVLCDNPISEEQPSDVTTAGKHYHIQCVEAEAAKDRTPPAEDTQSAREEKQDESQERPKAEQQPGDESKPGGTFRE